MIGMGLGGGVQLGSSIRAPRWLEGKCGLNPKKGENG